MATGRTPTALVLASSAYLVNAALGARFAIRENLPAAFGGTLRHRLPAALAFRRGQNDARPDFWFGWGTAIAPPAAILLLQAGLTAFCLSTGRMRDVGVKGLTTLGGAYLLGHAGEPIVYRVLRPKEFDPAKAAIVSTGMGLSLVMLLRGLSEIRRSAVKDQV